MNTYTARHAPHPSNRQNWAVDSEIKKGIFHGTEAEAKLFAAAPELLGALKVMLQLHYDEGMPSLRGLEAVEVAEAVIAKATQKSS